MKVWVAVCAEWEQYFGGANAVVKVYLFRTQKQVRWQFFPTYVFETEFEEAYRMFPDLLVGTFNDKTVANKAFRDELYTELDKKRLAR